MAPPNRWTCDDERPGSIFHEIVTLPTLAPNIARPEYLAGNAGPFIPLPQPRSQQIHEGVIAVENRSAAIGSAPVFGGSMAANAVQHAESTPEPATAAVSATGASSQSSTDENNNPTENSTPQRSFFVTVICERIEQTMNTRGPGKPKTVSETKIGPSLPILGFTRSRLVTSVFEVFGLHERYLPGPSGPPLRVSWKGSEGGKTNAPTVRTDEEWEYLVKKLSQTRVSTVEGVLVTFGLKDLEPYKNHKRPLSPDPYEENIYGTYVPNASNYTAQQQAAGRKLAELKAATVCRLHGHCYIDGKTHIPMTRFRFNAWVSALMSGNFTATEPPPDELLQEWRGKDVDEPRLPRARGRTGPNPSETSSSTSSGSQPDAAVSLLANLASVAPLMMSLMGGVGTSIPYNKPSGLSSPAHDARYSSPPPAIEDDLEICLSAFGRAKSISADALESALSAFQKARYTADLLGSSDVTIQRLIELTGFAEGDVLALKKFSREWCGRIETKRARRG